MKTQRRRLVADTDAIGLGRADLVLTLNETDSVNLHGVHYCFSIEPENADANANGFWIVYCLPGQIIASADLPQTFGQLGDEDFLPYVWGVGCWTASNQAPFHYEFSPSTSRNCQKEARIFCAIHVEGVSAGNVRINQTLTGFTS